MSKEKQRFHISRSGADSRITDSQVLLASAFIARNTNNPVEVLNMLGLTNDLRSVRKSRRHKKHEVTP